MSGNMVIYRPAENSGQIELRFYPPAAMAGPYEDWFAERIQKSPAGMRVAETGSVSKTNSGAYIALSKGETANGGNKVWINHFGCPAKNGAAYYAEFLLPQDETLLRKYISAAANVMGRACLDPAFANRVIAPVATNARPSLPGTKSRAAAPTAGVANVSGRGIKSSDIETVLNSWHQYWTYDSSMRQVMSEDSYLLLKDGTCLTELPKIPLEAFDAAADKAANPKNWGRWKKQGNKYLIATAGSDKFTETPNQASRVPARAGETIDGYFQSSSTSGYAGVSSWSTNSVKLSRDGRFQIGNSRGSAVSSAYGNGGMTMATSNNGESTVSSTGPGFVVGGNSKAKSGRSDYAGTYKLNGYTMELRFDSGRVQRQLFYTNDTRSLVWFNGGELLNLSKK